jgi:hypothetical protein
MNTIQLNCIFFKKSSALYFIFLCKATHNQKLHFNVHSSVVLIPHFTLLWSHVYHPSPEIFHIPKLKHCTHLKSSYSFIFPILKATIIQWIMIRN